MLKDIIILAIFALLAVLVSYYFEQQPKDSFNRTISAVIALILYIITLVLGIKFVIHFFVVIAKIW